MPLREGFRPKEARICVRGGHVGECESVILVDWWLARVFCGGERRAKEESGKVTMVGMTSVDQ